MWIIYLAKNRINGRRYVGATRKTLEHRRKRHIYDATHGKAYCRVFHAAIRKYGADAFDWLVLEMCETIEKAMATEKETIKRLKPEYNIAAGGRGIVGVPWSPERRAKILATMVGRKRTPEQIARMKGRPQDHLFKPIVCLQDRKVFPSTVEAARFYQIPKGRIACVLKGESTQTGGKSFIFGTEIPSEEKCIELLSALERRRNAEKEKRAAGRRKRAVLCLSTGERFESAKEAGAVIGKSASRVGQACLFGDLIDGRRYMYADMDTPIEKKKRTAEQIIAQKTASAAALMRGVETNKKRVVRLRDNMLFDSITAAARSCGTIPQAVSEAIYRNGSARGERFCFLDEWCPNPL